MKFQAKASNLLSAVCLAFGLSALAPSTAGAAALTIDDATTEGLITVSACDFEFGASVLGVGPLVGGLCSLGPATGGTAVFPEGPLPLVFDGSWISHIPPGPPGFIDRYIYLLEWGTTDVISDIFHYSIVDDGAVATIHAEFWSDFTEAGLPDFFGLLTAPPPPPGGPLVVDVYTEFKHDPLTVSFGWPALGGSITSDGDIPEPATLALLGLGLAGLGFGRRKKA